MNLYKEWNVCWVGSIVHTWKNICTPVSQPPNDSCRYREYALSRVVFVLQSAPLYACTVLSSIGSSMRRLNSFQLTEKHSKTRYFHFSILIPIHTPIWEPSFCAGFVHVQINGPLCGLSITSNTGKRYNKASNLTTDPPTTSKGFNPCLLVPHNFKHGAFTRIQDTQPTGQGLLRSGRDRPLFFPLRSETSL